jgi:hypothetical protein
MRWVAVAALFLALLSGYGAHAERRLFIIANDAESYGVDRCLVSKAGCGNTVANAHCHSHEYAQVISFGKVERDDIAGAISASDAGVCSGARCGNYVAMECSR